MTIKMAKINILFMTKRRKTHILQGHTTHTGHKREKAPSLEGSGHIQTIVEVYQETRHVLSSFCAYHRSGWVKQALLRFNVLKVVWSKTRWLQACMLGTVHLFCRYSLTQLEGCRRLVYRDKRRLQCILSQVNAVKNICNQSV